MLICELKLRKNLMKIFKVFFGSGFVPTHVGAPCCRTWQKFEIGNLRCRENLKLKKKNVRVVDVPLVGRHVVNEL